MSIYRLRACGVTICLLSCVPNLEVGSRAQIRCERDADCPIDLVCARTGFCAPPGATRPMATATVAPELGTVGTRFGIAIHTEDALLVPPQVSLLTSPARDISCEQSHSGDAWLCPYTADGTELGELAYGTVAFSVVLTGMDRSKTTLEAAGVVTLDFLVPQILPESIDVLIRPDPTNVLDKPVDLGHNSRLEVSFTLNKVLKSQLSEPLGPCASPATEACLDLWVAGPTNVPLSDIGSAGRFVIYDDQGKTAAELFTGTYEIWARGRDDVGNLLEATRLDAVQVDTDVPEDLTTEQLDALVVHRTPWGSDATGGEPQVTVGPAPAGSFTTGHALILWRRNSMGPVDRLGTMTVLENGIAAFELAGDLPEIYVSPVDGAGNVSANSPQRLPRMRWTATLGGKVAGSDVANPHEMVTAARSNRRFTTSLAPVDAASGVAEAGGAAAVTELSATAWRELTAGNDGPSARDRAGLVMDRSLGRLLLFGGAVSSGRCTHDGVDNPNLWGDTWQLADGRWQKLAPAYSPSPRAGFGMVYTDHLGVVLFGGCTATGQSNETYHFNDNQWRAIAVSGESPSPRLRFGMAYDTGRGRVVLFGGMSVSETETIPHGDTWEWDGQAWTQLTTNVSPPARSHPMMGFDESSGEVIVFGGMTDFDDASTFLRDTWRFNGDRWQEVTPAIVDDTNSPPASSSGAMAFDEARGQLILSGGMQEATAGITERVPVDQPLWAWDGVGWETVPNSWVESAANGPERRHSHNLVFDTDAQQLVSGFGTNAVALEDAWRYTGRSWARLGGASPPGITYPSLTIEPATQRPLLYGIHDPVGASWYGGTWRFFGAGWLFSGGDGAPLVLKTRVVGEPIEGVVLIAGGDHPVAPTEMRTWRMGYPSNWQSLTTVDPPVNRYDQAMAFDENRQRLLLYGGFDEAAGVYLDELWLWETNDPENPNDNQWVQPDRAPLSACDGWPVAHFQGRMVFDPDREVMVLLGGHPNDGLVWELDASCWHSVTPSPDIPRPIYQYAATFDPGLGEIVLFDGNEAWRYNGARFSPVPSPAEHPNPYPRSAPAAVYLDDLNAVLYFGGKASSTQWYDDTWLWRSDATTTVSHAFHIRLPETAGGEVPQLTDVDVHWLAGGEGPSGVTPGAALMVWEGGGWRDVGAFNDAPLAAPIALSWSTATDENWQALDEFSRRARLRRLVSGGEPRLSFAVTPREMSTPFSGPVGLTTDYLEVTVAYRLGQ